MSGTEEGSGRGMWKGTLVGTCWRNTLSWMRHASEGTAGQGRARPSMKVLGLWMTCARAGTLLRDWGQWWNTERSRDTPEGLEPVERGTHIGAGVPARDWGLCWNTENK